MTTNFPKLPGFVPTHDPTKIDHKKISYQKLQELQNVKNVPVPLYALPRPIQQSPIKEKTEESKSFSQSTYVNQFTGKDILEQFEPHYVKLDKQVSFPYHFIDSTLFCSLSYLFRYIKFIIGS